MAFPRAYSDEQLRAALEKTGGNKRAAARLLGVHPSSVDGRARTLGIEITRAGPGPVAAVTMKQGAPTDEVKALRAEVAELRKVSADLKAIQAIIGRIDAKVTDPPAWLLNPTKPARLVHGVPTLMLSDLHFGEVVKAAEVNQVNAYSTAIAKRRLRRVLEGSVSLLRRALAPGEFGGMVVQLNGDMVEGVIHDELRETVDETVMQAVITLHDELVAGLKGLADEFGRVFVPCAYGNHGRLDRKPRAKRAGQLNFDWLLYHFLARTIGADRKYRDKISFLIPEGRDTIYRLCGVRYLQTHGDTFRGGSGITGPLLPWMRGDAKTRKAYAAMNQPYDVLCMGHWHQLRFLGQIIVNGSLVGYNEYALRERFDYEPPQQALWLTHPVRGLTFQEPIFAEDPRPQRHTGWVEVPK